MRTSGLSCPGGRTLPRRSRDLGDVLVVTVRKSFWASPEAERFPHRVYAHVFRGHSTNLLNSGLVFVRALVEILRRRPRVVLLGSVERTVPWFLRARRLGLFRRARLVVTNQLNLTDEQLALVDRNVVYSQAWIDAQRTAVRERAVFVPLPADGVEGAGSSRDDGYVFSGGGAGRDFSTLIEALRDTDIPLRIVTFGPHTLDWVGPLPSNVRVEWTVPLAAFVDRLAGARVVAVPLRDALSDFGQTTLVQALSLGKPVVATRSPGVVDYVHDGEEGLLVDERDVTAFRAALTRLYDDEGLRERCRKHALARARLSSYSAFADRIEELCRSLDG
jgi:glycosyltransferase involved in cell wall biosynthesis